LLLKHPIADITFSDYGITSNQFSLAGCVISIDISLPIGALYVVLKKNLVPILWTKLKPPSQSPIIGLNSNFLSKVTPDRST